jgi:hypothetical protein
MPEPVKRPGTEMKGQPRPPRCSIVSAESAMSRPSRYAVASRALTQRPRPEAWQLSRRTGEEQGTAIGAGRSRFGVPLECH